MPCHAVPCRAVLYHGTGPCKLLPQESDQLPVLLTAALVPPPMPVTSKADEQHLRQHSQAR